MSDLKICLRDYDPDQDMPFVVHSWCSSNRGKADNSWLPDELDCVYWENYKPWVKKQIAMGEVKVCCLQKDPDFIVGWKCSINGEVAYRYIKQLFRVNEVEEVLK